MSNIKKLLFIQLFFLTINFLISEVTFNNIEDKVILNFYILESKFADGEYIKGDINQYGFQKYDNGFLPVKLDIKRRMYTFRTDFNIDESLKNENLSIFIGPTDYPYNVYLNGKIICKKGRYKNNYNSTLYYSENIYLSSDILKYGIEKNEFCIQVYPLFETKSLGKVILTSSEKVSFMVFLRNLFNVHLIQGACVVSIIVFLYFLLLFISKKFKEKKYLYFSLLCIFFYSSYFNIFSYYDSVNEVLLEKITRIGFSLTTTFLMYFILEYSELLKIKLLKRTIMGVILIPIIYASYIIFIQTSKQSISFYFQKIITIYILTPLLISSFILLIISSIIFINKKKNFTPVVIIFGYICVIITSIKDIIALTDIESPFMWTLPYGYLMLVLSIFFTLSIEQSQMFLQSLKHSNELNIKNITLKKVMEDTTIVSKSLMELSDKLNMNIIKTIEIIDNFDKSNKKIMGKIVVQFNYIEILIEQIAKRIDISSEKIPYAVNNQNTSVEEVNKTISEMNSHLTAISISVDESNKVSSELSNIADESTKIINESRESINQVGESSSFINDVLNYIEEITEKTNVLSINASIEAANKGDAGKGFAVIANEIRNLAIKSRNRLAMSLEKISDMSEIIEKSILLSDEVSNSLFKIITETKRTARKIGHINDLIHEQEIRSDQILNSVKNLLKDSFSIKTLFDEELNEYESIKSTLFNVKESFTDVTKLLKEQESRQGEINLSINNIKEIIKENLKNVDILNATFKEQLK